MLEWLQVILLVILVDRNLILRDRYKLALEINKPNKYGRGYVAFWIYCKQVNNDIYCRSGGRRLFYFKYGKQKL